MILGQIIGKVTPSHFSFKTVAEVKKFDYVQVPCKEGSFVLCQVYDLEKDAEKQLAHCFVIGHKNKEGIVKQPRVPFSPGTEVLAAQENLIKSIIELDTDSQGAYIGKLENADIMVMLNLNKLLTKHVSVIAKTGYGKSYCVGVLLEEIIEKKVPLLIIDAHGEYIDLKKPNDKKSDIAAMARFGVSPKGYGRRIVEYGDSKLNPNAIPLKLNEAMTAQEMIHILPAKLSNAQLGTLYGAVKRVDEMNLTNLLLSLENEESNVKWSIISVIEHLRDLNLFSAAYTPYNELVRSGRCSIINLRGINPDVQQIIVYKLLTDLFEERKKNKVPPFFAVIEEAHNYVPEKSYGEAKSSSVIRNLASEGRKFGLGLCVVSQRPARIEKNVLSQCTTQIILKVTNPNDLRAISGSVEGITAESENEIRNLPVGSALITGIVDIPLFVNIRPRRSKHGGEAVDILAHQENEEFMEKLDEFEEKGLLPILRPKISAKDIRLMSDRKIAKVGVTLVAAYSFLCRDKDKTFTIVMERIKGSLVVDLDTYRTAHLPDFDKLSANEIKVLESCFKAGTVSASDLMMKYGFGIGVNETLNTLANQGYLTEDRGQFSLSENYAFQNLASYSIYSNVEFTKVGYDDKPAAKLNLDQLKAMLSKFTSIEDHRECYVVRYNIQYE
ncbi:MAG: ATP-binding protein [archaeon]